MFGESPEKFTNCFYIFTHICEKLCSVVLNEISSIMRWRGLCIDAHGNVIVIGNANSQIKSQKKEISSKQWIEIVVYHISLTA